VERTAREAARKGVARRAGHRGAGRARTRQAALTSDEVGLGDLARRERICGMQDAKGRRLCIELSPPTAESKARAKKRAETLREAEEAKTPKAGKSPAEAAAAVADAPAVELVDWCWDEPVGKDCMTRTEACLKSVGSGTLVFVDADRDAEIGFAEFDFEQRIKAYPNKSASGSDFAEFERQIAIRPVSIDQALEGVTMKWNVGSMCQSCVTSNVKWMAGRTVPQATRPTGT
jgi:hypothetical protein